LDGTANARARPEPVRHGRFDETVEVTDLGNGRQHVVITDYVPGTTRNVFNRGNDADMMARVNAYRATLGMAALPVSQINTNEYYGLDVRASKSLRLSADRRVEL